MKRTNSRVPRTLRNQILREYLTSDLSASEIAARYDISPKTIDTWKHRYVYQKERVPLLKRQETTSNNSNDMNRKKDNTSYSPEVMELKEEIRKLQVALRQSELERLALDTMIDIAEEQGIRIRKKTGAKR